ncbi:two-component regulator propeller domain-containing protein [Niabella sp.]|uniref:hybrid sensor histidine kinase/response regulator transcription factor n=1 Tax=Niabella sp. TaxID=1962976 RepID=UPI0026369EE5|nr:two-component regulator propeller domain-containing protein [Niabella sp.]
MKPLLLTLLLCWSVLFAVAQKGAYNFLKINTGTGLSHNQVNTILKDEDGFVWFGTMSGLNRYDGYEIKTFRKKPGDSTSLKDNSVLDLSRLPERKMWVMTRAGSCVYDPASEKFEPDFNAWLQALGLPPGNVQKVINGKNGRFWFLYDNGKIYAYTEKENRARLIYNNVADKVASLRETDGDRVWIVSQRGILQLFDFRQHKVLKSFPVLPNTGGNVQYDLYVDADGDVWVWNHIRGICYLHPPDNTIRQFNEAAVYSRLNANPVTQVVQDSEGKIWIGTDHGGITVIDKQNHFSAGYILNDPQNPQSLSQNSINAIYKDESGIIWIGTYKQGVNFFNSDIVQFPLYRHQESRPGSLQFDDVNRFAEDREGNIWIGTNGGGLIYFNRKTNVFTRYLHDPNDRNSICANVIVSLCIDHNNNLWIGTYLGGLDRYDGHTFTHYTHRENDPSSISNNNVWELFEDKEQNLWIGTLGSGLDRFDTKTNSFEHFRADEKRGLQFSDYVSAILQDKKGNIWVGSANGLAVFNTKNQYHNTYTATAEKNSLNYNNIICLYEDAKGRIWIGTTDGLTLFNPGSGKFQRFDVNDGLPDNVILNVIEDANHAFWISTPNGLCNAIPLDAGDNTVLTIVNYDETNNLHGREFNENAAYKTRQGELIFGGTSGFNIINPAFIHKTAGRPKLMFTGLQVLNKNIEPGELVNNRVLLPRSIAQVNEVQLRYEENYFTIQFASLDFVHSVKDKYAYMLKGFNKEWVYTDGNQRRATYTNLSPGDYDFMVKVMNRDGVWSKVKTLHIKITPPFWRTNLAYIIYVLLVIGLTLLARKIILDRIHMRYTVAEQRKEAERTQAIEQMKTKFFTNVSHEFRTPLSLIIAPLDKLVKQVTNDDQRTQLNLVQRNAKRLLALVNQLLDFRKIQEQEMKLHPSFGDMIGFVKDISDSFLDVAEKKKIQFSFDTDTEHLEMYFDRDKIEKIMFNLLSNAFKYTSDSGRVRVSIKYKPVSETEKQAMVVVEVADTGIGIAPGDQERIFERFFQTHLPDSMVNQGTGIGLAITKEFVKLHKGVITVKSLPGQGTTFTLLIPEKKTPDAFNEGKPASAIPVDTESGATEKELNEAYKKKGKKTILIAEDNEDMRFYLKDNLKAHYQVIEAANGKEAWDKIKNQVPDMVVSDLMMPEMNGLELSKKIKTEKETAHIPVILLTAVGSEEKQLEGLQIGVNDYITKPFTFEILASRINNIIAQQELLHKRFQKQIEVNPKEIAITSVDEKFLEDALAIVEKNIADPDFSVESLSQALFMSRVTLYRKLLTLTGKTPIDFLKTIRLKKAALLLSKSGKSIAEIAYETGFNNPKNFTKQFKEEFNILPSRYIKQAADDAAK